MADPVKQPTDDELWAKVEKDRAATAVADMQVTTEPAKDEVKVDPADPMAGLPEPTRKLVEGLSETVKQQAARLQDVGQKLATAHGMMGSMKQRLDASQVELQKIAPTVAAVEAEKKAAAKLAADEKAAKIKEAREKLNDIPDVGEYLDLVLPADAEPATDGHEKAKAEAEAKAQAEAKAKESQAALPAEREAELIRQRELSDLHPGWIATARSPEFKAWIGAQPANLRALADSAEVADAAKLFDAFKKHQGDAAKVAQVEKERQERLRRGESVQGRGSSTGEVDTSPDALWNKVARDRAKARAAERA